MSAERSVQDRQRHIAQEIAGERRTALDQLGREAVLWLAVVPSWTRTLARACDFPSPDIDQFIDAAQAAGLCRISRATRSDEWQELRLLVALVPYLSPELTARALELALATSDSAVRAGALVDLAPRLDTDQLRRAVEAAAAGHALGELSATALAGLLPWVSASERERLLPMAMAAAAQMTRVDRRPQLMGQLARLANGDQDFVAATVEAARVVEDPYDRATALVAIADLLDDPADVLPQIDDVKDQAERAGLRVDLAPALTDPIATVQLAAAEARECADPGERSRLLLAVTKALADRDLGAAANAAQAIEDDPTRALAFGHLAVVGTRPLVAIVITKKGEPHRSISLLDRVRGFAAAIGDPVLRATVLASIVDDVADRRGPALSELVQQAIAAADQLPDDSELTRPLGILAPALDRAGFPAESATMAERGLRAAERIVDPYRRVQAGLIFTRHLSEDRAAPVLQQYVREVQSVDDLAVRTALLVRLLPQLSESQATDLVQVSATVVRERGSADAFWMPESARADLLGRLDGVQGSSESELHSLVATVAGKVLAVPEDQRATGAIRRWAALASQIGKPGAAAGVGRFLDRQVSRALDVQDLPSAVEWTDAASLLASTLGNELEGSVRYARRRMELVYRQRQEARNTTPLLERVEQLAAFQELLDGDGDTWALHFLGSGGVGKSTLISHLARNPEVYAMAVGRVDFDYLTPDYPLERPGQLLLELMAELQLYATEEHQENIVAAFHSHVLTLHSRWASMNPGDRPPRPIEDPDFFALLQSFCSYLILLQRRVVIFLDTCEELARWQPGDAFMPHVEATFTLMEQLRTMLAEAGVDLRVVFAGRRPLAAGNGPGEGRPVWAVRRRESGRRLPIRPFLRLHEVQGFTSAEAIRYLREVRLLTVSEELLVEILARSQDTRKRIIKWPKTPTTPAERRYLPFDLALYADWALADTGLTADIIRRGEVDPYIDRRIVGRIKSADARSLVPALALLRRADATLLERVYEGRSDDFRPAFESLADQEWIRRQSKPDSPSVVELQVEPRLRERLLTYYENLSRVAALNHARDLLLEELQNRLARRNLSQLPPLLVDDAVQMLDDYAATDQLHALVLDAAGKQRWDWIDALVRQLLGDDGLIGRRKDHPARAVVEAAHASWLLHAGHTTEAVPFWHAILRSADSDPSEARRQWLRQRATLGLFAAGEDIAPEVVLDLLTDFDSAAADRGEPEALQLIASYCAALQVLADRHDHSAVEPALLWCLSVSQLNISPVLKAYALCLASRWQLSVEPKDRVYLTGMATSAASALETTTEQAWLDLVLPASLRDRTRLELFILLQRPDVTGQPTLFHTWAVEATRTIEGDRLRSRLLEAQIARTPVDQEVLEQYENWDQYLGEQTPMCAAHHNTSPLFVTIAHGLLVNGRFEAGLRILETRLQAASTTDLVTARAAELGILNVVRRMRLPTHRSLVNHHARSDDPELRAAALAVLALDRPPAAMLEVAPDIWRYQSRFEPGSWKRLRALGESAGWQQERDRPTAERLDRLEWRSLNGADRRFDQIVRDLREVEDPHDVVRLSAFDVATKRRLPDLAPTVGKRRLGEIAFEEGELLALRLPHEGGGLLALASDLLAEAGDELGARLASLRGAIARAHTTSGRHLPSVNRAELEAVTRKLDQFPATGSGTPTPSRTGWALRRSAAAAWAANGTAPRARSSDPVELRLAGLDRPRAEPSRWPDRLNVTVGIPVAVGIFGLLAGLVKLLVNSTGTELSLLASIGIVIGAVSILASIGAACLRTLRQGLRGIVGTRSDVRIQIRPGDPVPARTAWPAGVHATMRLRIRQSALAKNVSIVQGLALFIDFYSALFSRRTARILEAQTSVEKLEAWQTPRLATYPLGLTDLPSEIVDPLKHARASSTNAVLRVYLDVPPELAGLPWEAVLASATADRQRPAPTTALQVSRMSGALADVPAPPHHSGKVEIQAPSAWTRGLNDLWAARSLVEPAWPHSTSAPRSGGRAAIVHAIGRPVTLRSGYQLQVSEKPAVRLDVETLTAGEDTALVVLQAPPYLLQSRTATDREEMARLKLLAHAVFASGTWAVVVVPTLPPQLATTVGQEFAKAMEATTGRFARSVADVLRRLGEREDPLARRLRHAQVEAQKLIRDWPDWATDADRQLGEELANDLCLYIRDRGPLG
ncbi:ATP-binding protein [Kribbella monticola]|uniref:ATP-binding protein n=1 Tax=Kribbella monticola TaxID=2185285 RepID=UPI000DD2CC9C|nr:ATP-binding protein [Kribbella monticola]